MLWIEYRLIPGCSLLDPESRISVADLYLLRVHEGGWSWGYCHRSTGEPIADAFSPLPTPRPERTSTSASNHRQRAHQKQALERAVAEWDRARRLFDARRRLVYWHDKLYRPYYSSSDRARFDAAEFPGSGGMDSEFPGSQEEFDELCDVPQWDDGIAWSGSDVDSDEGGLSA